MKTLELPIAQVGEMSKPVANVNAEFVKASFKPATEKSDELIAITVEGLPMLNERPGALLRTTKEARADLSAFESKEILAGFNGQELANAYEHFFRGNTVSFDASMHVKGSKYVATKDSIAVKQEKAEIGEELTAEQDGIWIEGFLTVRRSDEQVANSYEASKARVAKQLAEQAEVEA